MKLFRIAAFLFISSFLASCGGTDRKGPNFVDVEKQAEQITGVEGFYRTVQVDGTWWLLTPENEKFFTIGINHIDPNFFLADEFKEATIKKYGEGIVLENGMANLDGPEAIEFMNWGTKLVQSWGFNTIGAQNPINHYTMPWIATFRPADLEGWSFMKRHHPDPFAKDTAKRLYKKAADWSEGKRDDPNIIGITMTAMPIWHIKPYKVHEWVTAMMALPADAPGKKQWLQVMKERYPNATLAGQVYGAKVDTWDELAETQYWAVADWESCRIDQRVFLPRIARAWYTMVHNAMRKTMPNHLIFGDKLVPNRDMDDWMVPIMGDNVDVIYLQWFTHAEEQLPKLRDIYVQTGKPIVMGDFAFAHPNKYVPTPKGQEVSSQKDVGESYANYINTLAAEPYFMGLHHCGTFEGVPSLERIGPLVVRQQGFMRGDGTPYTEAVKRVTVANKGAFKIHDNIDQPEPLLCETIEEELYNLTKVGDRVYELRGKPQAGGAPQKPITWIIGDEAVAVYDTGSADLASGALQLIRSQTDLPIKYIIYSHHHGTQLAGAQVLGIDGADIIAHVELVDHLRTVGELGEYYSRLNSIQFNVTAGLPGNFPYPDITFRDRMKIDLGGVELELRHMVGESEDYTIVWWEEQRIAMVADMLPGGMPMVASPMKPVRNELGWIHGLEEIKSLRPNEVLRTAGIPTCSPKASIEHINSHIELLEYLHHSVMREMNRGSSEEEAVANIRMTREMKQNPHLAERYGTLAFAVRGLYHRYSGWFDQDGSHIKPAPRADRADTFIGHMGGRADVLELATGLIEDGNPAMALEFLDLLIDANDGDYEAHLAKSTALHDLAPLAENKIELNMFRRTSTNHRLKAMSLAPTEP